MKHIIIFAIAIISYLGLMAQSEWVVITEGTNFINQPQDFVFTPSGNILFINTSSGYTNSISTNEIIKMSAEGEILESLTFQNNQSSGETFTHIEIISDTVYIVGRGRSYNAELIPYILFKSFDLQLNEIESEIIPLDNLQYHEKGFSNGQLKYNEGKFIYLMGSGTITTHTPFYVEISKSGELLKFVEDLDGEQRNYPYDFAELPDNEGMLVFSLILEGLSGNGYRIKYDQGLSSKEKFLLPYNFFNFFTHLPINDTSFYLGGQWIEWASSEGWRAGIIKMTNSGAVMNEFLYETILDTTSCPAYRNSVDFTPDGNIIFCCSDNIILQLYPQLEPSKINLFKLSTDLEVIWHRYIGFEDSKNDAFVVRCNEDGEIVIFAALSPAPMSNYDTQLMFIKTDSDGLITGTDENLHGVRSTEAIIFPNPARDFVHVEFSMAYTNAIFVLQDINGNPVLETKLMTNRVNLDLAGVLPGSYVYRIYNQKGLDERGKLVVGR